jgi:hypothetical protein
MAASSPTHIPHRIPHNHSPRLHTVHPRTPVTARRHHHASHPPRGGGVKTSSTPLERMDYSVNGLTLTCKFLEWHCWESQETTTGAYGTCCKPAHTVHVVSNFISYFVSAPCIYVSAMFGIYVDDLPLACGNNAWVSEFKLLLTNN